jgi:hypothetical protein
VPSITLKIVNFSLPNGPFNVLSYPVTNITETYEPEWGKISKLKMKFNFIFN